MIQTTTIFFIYIFGVKSRFKVILYIETYKKYDILVIIKGDDCMREEQLRKEINILKNIRQSLETRTIEVTETLLSLLEQVGVNLEGYQRGDKQGQVKQIQLQNDPF